MHAAGTTTDTITVATHLAETGDLGKPSGVPYLHTLIADVPSTANTGHYAGIVADHAKRRKVAELGAQLATTSTDAVDLVATGRALLDEAGTPGGWATLIPLGRGRHLPPFPAELFPDRLAEQVVAVAEFTQTPIDLARSLALACFHGGRGTGGGRSTRIHQAGLPEGAGGDSPVGAAVGAFVRRERLRGSFGQYGSDSIHVRTLDRRMVQVRAR